MRLSSLLAVAIVAGMLLFSLSLQSEIPAADDKVAPDAAVKQRTIDFVRDVQPLLKRHCFKCHSGDKREGGLRLDRRSDALAGGDAGVAILKGDSSKSPLIERVSSADPDLVMPPEGDRLSAAEVSIFKRWIGQGAVWPDSAAGGAVRPDHWSYQSVVRPDLPTVRNSKWGRS